MKFEHTEPEHPGSECPGCTPISHELEVIRNALRRLWLASCAIPWYGEKEELAELQMAVDEARRALDVETVAGKRR